MFNIYIAITTWQI